MVQPVTVIAASQKHRVKYKLCAWKPGTKLFKSTTHNVSQRVCRMVVARQIIHPCGDDDNVGVPKLLLVLDSFGELEAWLLDAACVRQAVVKNKSWRAQVYAV